jgi:hypothetical protein
MGSARTFLLSVSLLSFVASAQLPFYNLTTNADGRVLYFTTTLRQKGTDLIYTPKIFRLDDKGLELATYDPREQSALRPIYLPARPLLKESGEVFALERRSDCSGRLCNSIQLHATEFRNEDGTPRTFDSRFILSRNRRYGAAMRKLNTLDEVVAEVWDVATWTKVWERTGNPGFSGTNVRLSDEGSSLTFR